MQPYQDLEAAAASEALPAVDDVAAIQGDYHWGMEYHYDLKANTEDGHNDTFLLRMYPGRVGYCQLAGRMKLKKRKRQKIDEPAPAKVSSHGFWQVRFAAHWLHHLL